MCIFIVLKGLTHTGGNMNFHVMFLFIVAIMFALSVAGLLGYHIYLTLRNQSTLGKLFLIFIGEKQLDVVLYKAKIYLYYVESFRPPVLHNYGPDKQAWNLGRSENWRQVFGDRPAIWFLPLYTALVLPNATVQCYCIL